MKNFSIIGIGGYIAPKHLDAIKKTGNKLVCCFDPNDSVGILDKYFPEANYFSEFERFERFIYKLSLKEYNKRIDYISICSPNYLHDSHIRSSLNLGANVICEKPLVLNPWNLDGLIQIENKTKLKVNTILQLRLHPEILKLKEKIIKENLNDYNITLVYIASRGNWYYQSWKGDVERSGGLATNIGIHFFDMLHFLFGKLVDFEIVYKNEKKICGFLILQKAKIRWFLSIDNQDIKKFTNDKIPTFRHIKVNKDEINFTQGFEDLHLTSYKKIMEGKGFGIKENFNAIDTVSKIRNAKNIRTEKKLQNFLKDLLL